jgi:hypothetical protein
MATHLHILANGTIEGLTSAGRQLRDLCHLNRPLLVEFRRFVLELIGHLVQQPKAEENRFLLRLLGFPDDLPNLRLKRPPGQNSRPEGITASYYQRRKRAELPEVY